MVSKTGRYHRNKKRMRKITTLILLLASIGTVLADGAPAVVAKIEGLWDVPAGEAVMMEAYRRIGVPVEFRSFNAAEALQQSNDGRVSAELQRIDGISEKFKNLVQIPIPINLIQGVAFSHKYTFPVSGWHSLRPYRIGIVEGILFAKINTYGMEVQVFSTYAELADALATDAIDVAVMPRVEGINVFRDRNPDGVTEMEGILETLFLYHYVHESRRELVDRLSEVLRTMLVSGETRRIREQVIAGFEESP